MKHHVVLAVQLAPLFDTVIGIDPEPDTADEVVSNYLSMSFAAPDRFGERLGTFVAELTAMLADLSPSGLFHDWPGDTAVIWAPKFS